MISLNRVIIAGAVTKTPELRTSASNRKFSSFTVAINDVWRDKEGEYAKRTTYVNVTCSGNLAQNVCKYISQGKHVMVEGKLSSDTYTDTDGRVHHLLKVDASSVVFCEKTGSKSVEE